MAGIVIGKDGTDPQVVARLSKVEGDVNNMLTTTIPDAQASITSLLSMPTQYVAGGSAMTVSKLLSDYPPVAAVLGKYARVSDLYGSVDDIMRCRFDGVAYRWVPQRESFSGNNSATSGTITLQPLFTPPTIRLTGTLVGNLSVTPSATNAYIGQRFRVVNNAVLSLLTASITGLIGSNLTILGGGSKDVEYGPSGWFSAA